jgi:hypothetical protein
MIFGLLLKCNIKLLLWWCKSAYDSFNTWHCGVRWFETMKDTNKGCIRDNVEIKENKDCVKILMIPIIISAVSKGN